MPIVDIYLLDGARRRPAVRRGVAGGAPAQRRDRAGADGGQLRRPRRRAPRRRSSSRRGCSARRCRRRCDPARARRRPARLVAARRRRRQRAAPGRRCLVEIAAMPSFVSPFSGASIAQCRTPTRSTTSICSIARFRGPAPAAECLWRVTLRYPERLDAARQQAAATRLGQRLPRLLALPRRAIVRRSARARRRSAGPTCGLPAALLTLDQPTAAPGSRSPLIVRHRRRRPVIDSERLGRADAAARRAHVGRRRPAARRRARGRPPLRRAADLHQEREPVARPRAAAEEIREFRARGRRPRRSVPSSRTPAI